MHAMSRSWCRRIHGILFWAGVCVAISALGVPALGQEEPPAPQAQEGNTLRTLATTYEQLYDEYLFDPTGAHWVRVRVPVRSVWGGEGMGMRYGWRKDKGGESRVYFVDGLSVPVTEESQLEELDFLEFCQTLLDPPEAAANEDDLERDEVFQRMRENAIGHVGISELYLAAWLDRLGERDLAKRMGERVPKPAAEDFGAYLLALESDLVWASFAGMVHAYMVRADEEALRYGEHLLEVHPDQFSKFLQAEQIVSELRRRKEEGTFGIEPGQEWPEGFAEWGDEEKIDYLIDELEEVDARQMSQPGGVPLGSDRRVIALVELGEVAVPRLIEVIESDERLTRSVHFWRDFSRNRTVLSVREAAVSAVMSILQVRIFQPGSTGDNLTARGEEAAEELATQLREYWAAWGHLPFDERMMAILTSEETTFAAKREAAQNLGRGSSQVRYSTTVFSNSQRAAREEGPNPVIEKFNNPTAAEAIFEVMLQDLAQPTEGRGDEAYRAYVEDRLRMTYLAALAGVKDSRIAPRLADLFEKETRAQPRRRLAVLCHYLDDSAPWEVFATEFAQGELPLEGMDDKQAIGELNASIGDLIRIGDDSSIEALWTVTDSEHRYHAWVAAQVLTARVSSFDDEAWVKHPYCLVFLREFLHDESPTGTVYRIEGNEYSVESESSRSWGNIPEYLADEPLEFAEERQCDRAAMQASKLVYGVPMYHPLLADHEQRFTRISELLRQYDRRYRALTREECAALYISYYDAPFLPDLGQLDHAATAEDFESGRAVFHLEGRGELTDLELPAVAVIPSDLPDPEALPQRGLIVQAERDSQSGEITYGIIFREGPAILPESEVQEVLPLVTEPPGEN